MNNEAQLTKEDRYGCSPLLRQRITSESNDDVVDLDGLDPLCHIGHAAPCSRGARGALVNERQQAGPLSCGARELAMTIDR